MYDRALVHGEILQTVRLEYLCLYSIEILQKIIYMREIHGSIKAQR